jgi:hypothetical protein
LARAQELQHHHLDVLFAGVLTNQLVLIHDNPSHSGSLELASTAVCWLPANE